MPMSSRLLTESSGKPVRTKPMEVTFPASESLTGYYKIAKHAPLLKRRMKDKPTKPLGWIARNMVDFFSKAFNESPQKDKFDRIKIEDNWAYKLRN